MATAVIDASVFTYALLNDSDRALTAIAACEQFDHWVAPHHLDVECLSAWRSMVRRGEATAADALRAMDELMQARIDRYDSYLLAARIWSLQDNLSSYDAAYVAVAEDIGAPVVTRDARLARAPGSRCSFLLVE